MDKETGDSDFATKLALIWPELRQRLHSEIISRAAEDNDFCKAGAIVLACDTLITAIDHIQSAQVVKTKQFTRPGLHPHNTQNEQYNKPTSS